MATQQQPTTAMAISETPTPVAIAQTETTSTAVAAREQALVQAKFLVAMRNPRNPDLARQRLLLRCQSPVFAQVAEYSKPIGGKSVTGGSIRLMEEIARQWGNIDVTAPVVFDDPERRIITVTATDLETNYSQTVDVIVTKTVERKFPKVGDAIIKERLNSRNEKVYLIEADEDAFLTKQNANVAKARREMIRAIVPGDLVEEAIQQARETRKDSDAKDPKGARKAIADAFFRMGVMANQVTDLLGKESLESITDAELELLRQIYTAIREGETTWQEVVADKKPQSQQGETPVAGKGTQGLKETLAKKKTQPEPAPPSTSYTMQVGANSFVTYASATECHEAVKAGKATPFNDAATEKLLLAVDAERKE